MSKSEEKSDKTEGNEHEEFVPKGLTEEQIKYFKMQSDVFKLQFENMKGCCGD